ncbi:unnamed protein product [Closterium sp. NIES-53]
MIALFPGKPLVQPSGDASAPSDEFRGADGRVYHSHDGLAPHSHEPLDSAGSFALRAPPLPNRDLAERAFTVGIGGPVGSGKTALMLALCRTLRDQYSLAAVTNDIFTQEDGEFLIKHAALSPPGRIRAVETGGCPHAAIREDISINLGPLEELSTEFKADMLLCESGGDNLAANFSRELADYIIYIIDVSGGDKIPRKGGPGITQADLLVVNKTDLAPAIGADLAVMETDALRMRDGGPLVFAQVKHGVGVPAIVDHVLTAWSAATGQPRSYSGPCTHSMECRHKPFQEVRRGMLPVTLTVTTVFPTTTVNEMACSVAASPCVDIDALFSSCWEQDASLARYVCSLVSLPSLVDFQWTRSSDDQVAAKAAPLVAEAPAAISVEAGAVEVATPAVKVAAVAVTVSSPAVEVADPADFIGTAECSAGDAFWLSEESKEAAPSFPVAEAQQGAKVGAEESSGCCSMSRSESSCSSHSACLIDLSWDSCSSSSSSSALSVFSSSPVMGVKMGIGRGFCSSGKGWMVEAKDAGQPVGKCVFSNQLFVEDEEDESNSHQGAGLGGKGGVCYMNQWYMDEEEEEERSCLAETGISVGIGRFGSQRRIPGSSSRVTFRRMSATLRQF